jgi:hypothetical protein
MLEVKLHRSEGLRLHEQVAAERRRAIAGGEAAGGSPLPAAASAGRSSNRPRSLSRSRPNRATGAAKLIEIIETLAEDLPEPLPGPVFGNVP